MFMQKKVVRQKETRENWGKFNAILDVACINGHNFSVHTIKSGYEMRYKNGPNV